jgi:hypothetical protein
LVLEQRVPPAVTQKAVSSKQWFLWDFKLLMLQLCVLLGFKLMFRLGAGFGVATMGCVGLPRSALDQWLWFELQLMALELFRVGLLLLDKWLLSAKELSG